MRNKKFIIVALVLLAALLLLLLYAMFSEKQQTPPVAENTPTPFEPFGNGAPDGNFENALPTEFGTTTLTTTRIPRLRKLSEEPVAGFTMVPLLKKEGEEMAGVAARFVDRATGHILETRIDAISPIAVLSNTTIPQVADAEFGNAEMLYISYLNQDAGVPSYFLARIIPSATSTIYEDETEQTPAMLDGRFLPATTKWLSFNATGTAFAYLVVNASGSGLFNYDFTTQKVTQLFTTPLREVMPEYFAEDVILSTLPSYGINGQSLRISKKEAAGFLFADVPTLMVHGRKEGGELIALRFDEGGGAGLFHRIHPGTAEEKDTRFPFTTLPEKCTWVPGFSYRVLCAVPEAFPAGLPDTWLKGDMILRDRIVSFNVQEYTTLLLADPLKEVNSYMDVIKPAISEDGRFYLFINRIDGALWALDLTQK